MARRVCLYIIECQDEDGDWSPIYSTGHWLRSDAVEALKAWKPWGPVRVTAHIPERKRQSGKERKR